jgi:hypothetical protein
MPLPLWNQGQELPLAAQVDLRQFPVESGQQELLFLRELENAYNRYLLNNLQH